MLWVMFGCFRALRGHFQAWCGLDYLAQGHRFSPQPRRPHQPSIYEIFSVPSYRPSITFMFFMSGCVRLCLCVWKCLCVWAFGCGGVFKTLAHPRSDFTGNPGMMAAWADEGLNRNLAVAARAVHSMHFERDLLSRFASREVRPRSE